MSRYYTAVGSRDTPVQFVQPMMKLSKRLRELGWVFRSGKADGADAIFQSGAQCHKVADYNGLYGEVYKPWKLFNTTPDALSFDTARGYTLWNWYDIETYNLPNWKDAQEIVQSVINESHWNNLSVSARNLHTRNVYQVLGKDLQTPSEFLVCYSKPSKDSVSGGTKTAWELAKKYNVPCFNYATMSPKEIGEQIKLIVEGK